MNLASPLSALIFVNAAVNVVLPWSTCPIVPILTCGFRRSYFAFAILRSFSRNLRKSYSPGAHSNERADRAIPLGAHDADRTRDLVLTKDVLYQLSYVGLFFVKRQT